MQSSSDSDGILAIFAGAWILTILAFLVFWGVCGLIAWVVAPDDRRWTFFWLTFLLFGPIGILAASVASPRDPDYFADALNVDRPRASGRERFWCSRCGAQSDLFQLKGNECWRCGEKRFIAAKSVTTD